MDLIISFWAVAYHTAQGIISIRIPVIRSKLVSSEFGYLKGISGIDDPENLERYKTYMHFGQISYIGKLFARNLSNMGYILSIS